MLLIQHNFWKSQALHFLCHTITVNCCLKRGHQLPQYKCLFCSRYHVVIQLCNDSFRICPSKHWVPVIIFPGRKSSSHTGSFLFYVWRSINRCLFGMIMRWNVLLVWARREKPSFFSKKSNKDILKILGREPLKYLQNQSKHCVSSITWVVWLFCCKLVGFTSVIPCVFSIMVRHHLTIIIYTSDNFTDVHLSRI